MPASCILLSRHDHVLSLISILLLATTKTSVFFFIVRPTCVARLINKCVMLSNINTSKHRFSRAGARSFLSNSSGLCRGHWRNHKCQFLDTFIYISVCDCTISKWCY